MGAHEIHTHTHPHACASAASTADAAVFRVSAAAHQPFSPAESTTTSIERCQKATTPGRAGSCGAALCSMDLRRDRTHKRHHRTPADLRITYTTPQRGADQLAAGRAHAERSTCPATTDFVQTPSTRMGDDRFIDPAAPPPWPTLLLPAAERAPGGCQRVKPAAPGRELAGAITAQSLRRALYAEWVALERQLTERAWPLALLSIICCRQGQRSGRGRCVCPGAGLRGRGAVDRVRRQHKRHQASAHQWHIILRGGSSGTNTRAVQIGLRLPTAWLP